MTSNALAHLIKSKLGIHFICISGEDFHEINIMLHFSMQLTVLSLSTVPWHTYASNFNKIFHIVIVWNKFFVSSQHQPKCWRVKFCRELIRNSFRFESDFYALFLYSNIILVPSNVAVNALIQQHIAFTSIFSHRDYMHRKLRSRQFEFFFFLLFFSCNFC